MAEDDIVHLIDDPSDEPPEQGPRWKIAVIDDEPAVHDGTRFALARLPFERAGTRDPLGLFGGRGA